MVLKGAQATDQPVDLINSQLHRKGGAVQISGAGIEKQASVGAKLLSCTAKFS